MKDMTIETLHHMLAELGVEVLSGEYYGSGDDMNSFEVWATVPEEKEPDIVEKIRAKFPKGTLDVRSTPLNSNVFEELGVSRAMA